MHHKRHAAYLTDRVAMNEGRPQIYGTQISDVKYGEVFRGRSPIRSNSTRVARASVCRHSRSAPNGAE